MGYVVKSPLVVARKDDGTYVHVYEGGVLPENTDAAQLAQLVGAKMVAEGEAEKPKRSAKSGE